VVSATAGATIAFLIARSAFGVLDTPRGCAGGKAGPRILIALASLGVVALVRIAIKRLRASVMDFKAM
jgi:hypothetical protein